LLWRAHQLCLPKMLPSRSSPEGIGSRSIQQPISLLSANLARRVRASARRFLQSSASAVCSSSLHVSISTSVVILGHLGTCLYTVSRPRLGDRKRPVLESVPDLVDIRSFLWRYLQLTVMRIGGRIDKSGWALICQHVQRE